MLEILLGTAVAPAVLFVVTNIDDDWSGPSHSVGRQRSSDAGSKATGWASTRPLAQQCVRKALQGTTGSCVCFASTFDEPELLCKELCDLLGVAPNYRQRTAVFGTIACKAADDRVATGRDYA